MTRRREMMIYMQMNLLGRHVTGEMITKRVMKAMVLRSGTKLVRSVEHRKKARFPKS